MKERYEQEIEQLLGELESERPETTPKPVDAAPPLDDQPSPFAPKPRERVRLISPTKLAITGAVVAGIGLLVVKFVWLAMAGLLIMAGAIAWMLFQRMGSQPRQYWRGRAVEQEPRGAWERFRRWLAK